MYGSPTRPNFDGTERSVVLNDSGVILPLTDLADVPVVGVRGIGC